MIRPKKVLSKLKTNIELMNNEELNWILKYYENDLMHISIESGINNLFVSYNNYLEVDENIRNEYEQLQAKLESAKLVETNLNMIDPRLYELYHNGECSDFYMGSIAERVANMQEIASLQSQIAILESNEPRLKFRDMQETINVSLENTILYYSAKQKIKIIKREIKRREKQQELDNLEQKNKS